MSSYQARVRRIYPRARLRRAGPGPLPWRVFVPAQAGRPALTLSDGPTPAGAWRMAADLVDPPVRRVVRRKADPIVRDVVVTDELVMSIPVDHPLIVGVDVGSKVGVSCIAEYDEGRIVRIYEIARVEEREPERLDVILSRVLDGLNPEKKP